MLCWAHALMQVGSSMGPPLVPRRPTCGLKLLSSVVDLALVLRWKKMSFGVIFDSSFACFGEPSRHLRIAFSTLFPNPIT